MKEIREMLEEARFHIDWQVNCHTSEYAALDKLERAVSMIVDKLAATERAAYKAANEASCSGERNPAGLAPE